MVTSSQILIAPFQPCTYVATELRMYTNVHLVVPWKEAYVATGTWLILLDSFDLRCESVIYI